MRNSITRTDWSMRHFAAPLRPRDPPPAPPPPPAPAPAARATALVVGPIVPTRTDLDNDSPELARARALASSARGLLPPQSPLADDAKNLAEQPQAALRDLRKRQVDA